MPTTSPTLQGPARPNTYLPEATWVACPSVQRLLDSWCVARWLSGNPRQHFLQVQEEARRLEFMSRGQPIMIQKAPDPERVLRGLSFDAHEIRVGAVTYFPSVIARICLRHSKEADYKASLWFSNAMYQEAMKLPPKFGSLNAFIVWHGLVNNREMPPDEEGLSYVWWRSEREILNLVLQGGEPAANTAAKQIADAVREQFGAA